MYDERCLKIIGANIKLLRTCRGISQGELARALVISQTHLSNIECCRVAVNFRVLLRAANALECTLDDLLQLEFTEPPRTVMEVQKLRAFCRNYKPVKRRKGTPQQVKAAGLEK